MNEPHDSLPPSTEADAGDDYTHVADDMEEILKRWDLAPDIISAEDMLKDYVIPPQRRR